MKKLFTLFVMSLFMVATSAFADQSTWVMNTTDGIAAITVVSQGTPSTGGDLELTKDGITATSAAGYFKGTGTDGIQIYKTGTLTITAPEGKVITEIILQYPGSCYPFAEAVNEGGSATTKTPSQVDVTFTPETAANAFTFTNAAAGQTKVKKLTITYENAPSSETGWNGTVTTSFTGTVTKLEDLNNLTLTFPGATTIGIVDEEDCQYMALQNEDGSELYGIWGPTMGSAYTIEGNTITLDGFMPFEGATIAIPAGTAKLYVEDYGTLTIDGEGQYLETMEFDAEIAAAAEPFMLTSVVNNEVAGTVVGAEASENGVMYQFEVTATGKALSKGEGVPTLSIFEDASVDFGAANIIAYEAETAYIRFMTPAQQFFTTPGTYVLSIPEGTFVDEEGTPNAAAVAKWVIIDNGGNEYGTVIDSLDLKLLTGTNANWANTVNYPMTFAVQGAAFGDGDGSNEATHVDIEDYEKLSFVISEAPENAGTNGLALRVWIWDDAAQKVVTLYPHPEADFETADFTQRYGIKAPGVYSVDITNYKHLKGVKAANDYSAQPIVCSYAFVSREIALDGSFAISSATNMGNLPGSVDVLSYVFEINAANAITALNEGNITLTDANGEPVGGNAYVYGYEGDGGSATVYARFTFDSEDHMLHTPGSYTLNVPAGMFKDAEGHKNKEYSAKWKVTYQLPAGAVDVKDLTGTEANWANTVNYPMTFAVQGAAFGNGDGSSESTHVSIEGYDKFSLAISEAPANAATDGLALRLWIWDDVNNQVVTLYPHPEADFETADFTQRYGIKEPGIYSVNISGYKHLKGVKAANDWNAQPIVCDIAYVEKAGNAPAPFDITAAVNGADVEAGAEVEALSYAFAITAANAITALHEGNITLTDENNQTVGGNAYVYGYEGDGGSTTVYARFAFDTEDHNLHTPGTYTLNIPAGMFKDAQGNLNNEFAASWTVKKAEDTDPTILPEFSAVANGDFYFFNVEYGGFLVGANDWGTRASVSREKGLKVAVSAVEGGTYKLGAMSPDNMEGIWIDGSRNGNDQFTLTEGENGTYLIGNTKFPDTYITWTGDEANTRLNFTAEATNGTWGLVSQEAYDAYWAAIVAAQEAKGIYTHRMSNDKAAWAGASGVYGGGAEKYIESGVPEGEILVQTIENLPAGNYELKFYAIANVARNLNVDEFAGDSIAYAFANDAQQDITVGTKAALADEDWAAGVRTFNVEVGEEGVIRYGIANRKAGGQWYVVKAISLIRDLSSDPTTFDITAVVNGDDIEAGSEVSVLACNFTITAANAIAGLHEGNITLVDENNQRVGGNAYCYGYESEEGSTTVYARFTFDTDDQMLHTPGTYTLNIPAGMFVDAKGLLNTEFSASWTIKALPVIENVTAEVGATDANEYGDQFYTVTLTVPAAELAELNVAMAFCEGVKFTKVTEVEPFIEEFTFNAVAGDGVEVAKDSALVIVCKDAMVGYTTDTTYEGEVRAEAENVEAEATIVLCDEEGTELGYAVFRGTLTLSKDVFNITGINNIQFNVTEVIYNLNGQRVSKANGIVIKNGVKMIEK
ncbi:MAG: hypothetical protein KBT20_10460 [Bacteroidales bacterium]|nr:hypothetical protein [Candidatus Liminaster caballi]